MVGAGEGQLGFFDRSDGLRGYQRECLQAIGSSLKQGCRRQLVSMATGLGKTHVFARLPSFLGTSKMLVLAHRKELLDQARSKLIAANPTSRIGLERAEHYATGEEDVVVASVQSLVNKSRLEKFPADHWDLIVVDEAHHSTAPSYLKILRHYGAGERAPLIGFTATPFRGDGVDLSSVFEKVVYEKGLEDGVREQWLCPVRALKVWTDEDISNVHTRAGDFRESELADKLNTDYRNSLIVSAIKQHALDRTKILLFAVDVAHVMSLAKQLEQVGLPTGYVTGSSPDREDVFRRFKQGDLTCLVNCEVATEGYDEPGIDCLVMARPTKSPLLYAQMLGRGTRTAPGKTDLLVIDVVDVCGRHAIQTAATAFGLADVDLLGGDILVAKDQAKKLAEKGMHSPETVDEARLRKLTRYAEMMAYGTVDVATRADAVDLFAAVKIAEEVEHESKFPWIKIGPEKYVLNLPTKMQASLWRDELGTWYASAGSQTVGGWHSLESAPFREADRWVKRWSGKHRIEKEGQAPVEIPGWKVLSMDARWRTEAPTQAQLQLLRVMGFKALPPKLNKGTASQMISHIKTMRAVRRSAYARP